MPTVEERKPTPNKICVVLYYPNNYSGKDDRNGVVNPIYYLMNGVGTQKYVDPTTKDAEDIPTRVDFKPSGNMLNNGGYEVDYGAVFGGISQVLEELEPDYDVIKSTYADLTTKDRKAQYLTSNDGTKRIISYGDDSYELAKIVGSKAMSLGNAKSEKNLTGNEHLWYRKRYYYRVDKEYENQDFSNPMSYIDAKSYGLNGNGYETVRQHSNAIKEFGIENDSETFRLCSFTDLFSVLEGESVIEPTSSVNVKFIKEVLQNKEKYTNIKVSFKGHASYQGYGKTNNDLAQNRALTLKNWLSSFQMMNGVEMGDISIINQPLDNKRNVGDVDDDLVKIWRSASVIIEYNTVDVENAATAESTTVDENGNTIVDRTEVKNKETSRNNIMNAYDWLHESPEGKAILSSNPQLEKMGYSITMQEIAKAANIPGWDGDDIDYNVTSESSYGNGDYQQSIVKRYDNEGEFFQTLNDNEPFLHHLISEKIKYFDPAFHSISPEGFNARLTFLHQCTRQGSTVGNSDSGFGTTAYNLAFGRPPVCVLRVGDFYYTKIIITSLSIQYDQPQWDMNPEGIGMMPMFADISINFVFLGGSDLAGPIARLQNAVSFNYYANASVYDNRAEKVEYDPNGSGKEIKFKGYLYPNMYVGDRLNKERLGTKDEQGKTYAEDF